MSSNYDGPTSPGSIRPSQLITSFGPGSIFQTENDSVLIMGLQNWSKVKKKYKSLHHPVLQGITRKKGFKVPISEGKKEVITCVSFPSWGVCTQCKRLQQHNPVPKNGETEFHCMDCNETLVYARFIVMCDNGHIDEFPWARWAHKNEPEYHDTEEGTCKKPKLYFYSKGRSPGLSNYFIKCVECNSKADVGSAISVNPNGLLELDENYQCSRKRPWLGDVDSRCDQIPYGVQTRASNVYFPSVISAVYVKKWVNEAQQIIRENLESIQDNLQSGYPPEEIAERQHYFKNLKDDPYWTIQRISDEIRRWEDAEKKDYTKSSESEIKKDEYDDMTTTKSYESDDFHLSTEDVHSDISPYVESLKTLKRITELKVIRGFTRGQAADPFSPDSASNVNYCPLSTKNENWLPAVENHGEGIFFTLNSEKLRKWEEENNSVKLRFSAMKKGFLEWAKERRWQPDVELFSPRYVLLHTLAHLMIMELSNSVGYNAASIRERIYGTQGSSGIMLYTSSSSAEGSLGGLVRLGESISFKDLLLRTISRSRRCSRDPLCDEEDPMKKQNMPPISRLNGSACYACCLVPETSCENSNRLLDRQFIHNDEYGFFKDLE